VVIAAVPGVGWATYSVLARGVWWPGIYGVIQLAAVLWLLPLFAFVALTGRTPRSWPGFGSNYSKATSSSK
jgi:hypothetical protein